MKKPSTVLVALVALAALVAGACSSGGGGSGGDADRPVRLTLGTHDSFAVSDEVLADLEAEAGVELRIVRLGDAGEAVNKLVLTRDDPVADVFFGVDNTFLTRALEADVFVPYRSPRLEAVPDRFELDERVTPVDHGFVCVNYDREAFGPADPAPASLDDLAAPAHRDRLVVPSPATSSPGLAFLLATVARYGEDGWRDYWARLRANGVQVTSGWDEAYNGAFSGGSGGGSRPLVVSYASSPPAEVVFGDPPPAEPTTAVLTDGCFEQVEMAGIVRGTSHEAAARRVVDFLLSPRFQEDMPLQMFVHPVADDAEAPEVFRRHAAEVPEPLRVSPADIDANRERWIREWTATVID